MLLSFLEIEKNNKDTIDLNYNSFIRRVKKTKEQETKSIIDFLESLDKDQLNTEKMMKKYKMERWNIGLQKSNFIYDANTYDANRTEGLARMHDEFLEINEFENPQVSSLDIEDLDHLQEKENEELYDAEGEGIDHLDENYGDGAYYEEDVDKDFGYDD